MKDVKKYVAEIKIVATKGNIGLRLLRKNGYNKPYKYCGTSTYIKDRFLFRITEHENKKTIEVFILKDCNTRKLLSKDNALKVYERTQSIDYWEGRNGFIIYNSIINDALSQVFNEIEEEYEKIMDELNAQKAEEIEKIQKAESSRIVEFANLLKGDLK